MSDIYWQNELLSRKYNKRIAIFIVFNQAMHIVTLTFALIAMCTGTFDASQINMPFHLALPFNTASKVGWLLFWLIDFNMAFTYAVSMVSMTSYFVGCCLYMDSICWHFELLIRSANENAQLWQDEEHPLIHKNYERKIGEILSQAIEMHYKLVESV